MRRAARALEPGLAVYAACATSLVLGVFFIFVWAPHPWGWRGIDHYHEFALEVAAGHPFSTMDIPWAYTYYLAAFYRLFGARPHIPMVVQAALNAMTPLLVFHLARWWFDRRTAVVAAVLTGVLSFNTVYASTESSDALCTVTFLAAIGAFVRGEQRGSAWWFAAAGAFAGLAAQFRPNLIVLPLILAAFRITFMPKPRRAADGAAVLACAIAVLTPWIARNYQLTSTLLPTSVHGGVQLWYGTLQTGPYLRSRAYNPRSIFEAPAFPYTSLEDVPIVVEASFNCSDASLDRVELVYWSDADANPRRAVMLRHDGGRYVFQIGPPRHDAVVYSYLAATWTETDGGTAARTMPPDGPHNPAVYFVSQDHLGDLDRHDDVLDLFDVVRLVRAAAWHEPVNNAAALHSARIEDAAEAVAALLRPTLGNAAAAAWRGIDADDSQARVVFSDASTLVVPRAWQGRVTDLIVTEGMAAAVMTSTRSMRELALDPPPPTGLARCEQAVDVNVNQVFYRREPHMMRRYMALALDNIRRDPRGFAAASAYRAVRLFVIEGASDSFTAHQFSGSGWIYRTATAASLGLVLACAAGVVISWRRGRRIALPLMLILSVPATLAPVLINMRYTLTMQPLMFMFVAAAITALPPFAGERPRFIPSAAR